MIRIQVGKKDAIEFNEDEILKKESEIDIREIGDKVYSVIWNRKSYEIIVIDIDYDSKSISLSIDGRKTDIKVSNKMDLLLERMGIDMSTSKKMTILKSPMPGLVIDWFVKEGDEVKEGDKLLILEAMKMENIIKSSGEGIIKKITASKGDAVEKNQVLIEFQ